MNATSIKKLISERESGVYRCIGEENEDLIVRIKKGIRMDVELVQKNGRSQIRKYNASGSFDGIFHDK